jgi:hypothetical protein
VALQFLIGCRVSAINIIIRALVTLSAVGSHAGCHCELYRGRGVISWP